MVKPLSMCAALLIASMPLASCKREREWHDLNESLRLTPEQITRDERAADAGDAQAAKRLWHHYAAELDMEKGEAWRKRYENLSASAPVTK